MNEPLRLVVSVAFAIGLAACSSNGVTPALPSAGGQSPDAIGQSTDAVASADATYPIPEWQAKHEAQPACGGPRTGGLFQCDALIYNRTAGMSPDSATGLTPADFQAAYKLPSNSRGAGQIVAIVDAYDNPDVAADLTAYRSQFGLGTAKFTKYNQDGEQKDYPKGNREWGVEIDLDTQMVSASCPKCTIYLIEAKNNGGANLYAAEKEAVKLGAAIVTSSWGGGAGAPSGDAFNAPGVAYFASAGDYGYGMQDPADYANVVSVGGTNLRSDGSSGYTETVWDGTGGGCAVVTKPSWQSDPLCKKRTGNDVTAPASYVAEYDSYQVGGWIVVGGTSAASPLIAGVVALAGNAASFHGGETFWKLNATEHKKDFNTTITGTMNRCPKKYAGTYVCTAGLTGSKAYESYSGPTGWGSPRGIAGF